MTPGAAPDTLSVDAPANPNVAPPGCYMLFVVDDKGVPSVARSLTDRHGRRPTPSRRRQPGGPTATRERRRRRRSTGPPSTDNVGVTEYRVHRSTTAGFTPSAANRIATVELRHDLHGHRPRRRAPTTTWSSRPTRPATPARPRARRPPRSLPDTTPPTVSVTAPAAGATVAGTVSRDRQRGRQPRRRRRAVPGSTAPTSARRTRRAPYSRELEHHHGLQRPAPLTAVARDAAGNADDLGAASHVTVDNGSAARRCRVTAPAHGATVSGTINVTANAADDRGLADVQFRLDGGEPRRRGHDRAVLR